MSDKANLLRKAEEAGRRLRERQSKWHAFTSRLFVLTEEGGEPVIETLNNLLGSERFGQLCEGAEPRVSEIDEVASTFQIHPGEFFRAVPSGPIEIEMQVAGIMTEVAKKPKGARIKAQKLVVERLRALRQDAADCF